MSICNPRDGTTSASARIVTYGAGNAPYNDKKQDKLVYRAADEYDD